jgi:hypothetical protein
MKREAHGFSRMEQVTFFSICHRRVPLPVVFFLLQKEEKGEDAKYFSNKLSPSQKKKTTYGKR